MLNAVKRFIPLIAGSAGFLMAAGAALAFSGGHSFSNVYSVSSDGHSAVSSYQARGSFPFNGQGTYDGTRINLLGTLTVNEQDGTSVNPPLQYCIKVQGKVNDAGQGSVTVSQYKDLRCKGVVSQGTYEVSSYTEVPGGDFSLQYQDSAGVMTTVSGTHTYIR